MFERLNWVAHAIISGLLFGHGIILTNLATRGKIGLINTIIVFGFVWVIIGSCFAKQQDFRNLGLQQWYLIIAAGILFFVGNFFQFQATLSSPMSSYALIVITIVGVVVTTAYDTFRLWRNGALEISALQVIASILCLFSIILFTLSSRKG